MNFDHEIFIKKSQSIELANQVEEFLHSKALTEPTQIPFGHSELSKKSDWNRSPILKNLENAAEKLRANFNSSTETISEHTRIDFNRSARAKAFKDNQKKFIGICRKLRHGKTEFVIFSDGLDHKCILCKREQAQKYKKENRKEELL